MIKDKVVIITGASSGIGEAAAKLLAQKGAKVVLGAPREDKLEALAEAIARDGGQAVYRVLDVTKPAENDAIVNVAKESFGRVDAIFLNAGLMPSSPVSAVKTDEWDQMCGREHKGRAARRRRRYADLHRPEVRAHPRNLVCCRPQGLPECCSLRRHQVVRAQFHGSVAHGIGHGRH